MGTIEDIINAIIRQEDPNNPQAVHSRMVTQFGKYDPGHLVYAGQRGASPIVLSTGGRSWAGWNSWQEGVQGIRNQIRLDARRGHTLESFIHKYAPVSENPTSVYVANVEAWTGIPRGTSLSQVADPLGGYQGGGGGPGWGEAGWPVDVDPADGSGGGGWMDPYQPSEGPWFPEVDESQIPAMAAVGAGILLLALLA